MKRFFLLLAVFVFTLMNVSIAQKQNVYFMTNPGKEVSTKDSADFIKIVSEPDSGTVLYNIAEYYLSGKPKLVGKTSSVDGSMLEGRINSFFPDGKRKQVAYYLNHVLDGEVHDYFPNGRLYTIKEYSAKLHHEDDFLIKTCNDSLGKSLVIDGNGYFVDYDEEFKIIADEGPVVNAVKDGLWKGVTNDKDDPLTYTEQYEKGKLLSGQSVDKNGQVYNYTARLGLASYKGREAAFENYLRQNIIYPQYAREHNIQGRVYINFTVEKDGTLTNFKIVKSVDPLLGAEALRVLKIMPKWNPGFKLGRISTIDFTVPINFSLGSDR